MSTRPHVVIVGGGFGGLTCARELARAPVEVTIVDRRNHHLFQPLLYQVATAGLNPSDIAAPIRRILRSQRNATVVLGEVANVDTTARRVRLADRTELAYDFLVVATGTGHAYFGHDEWAEHAPGLKSIEDALEIRRRVLLAFEAAERETDPARRRAWLTLVVIGGGPTGVELAGALSEIARHALVRDFRRIDPREARVLLIEGQDRILSAFPPDLSVDAERQLAALGAEVRKKARVTAIDARGLSLGPERIEARTVLWAAGVQGSPLARTLGVPLDRAGRVVVEPDLSIPGHPEVIVVGDLAAAKNPDGAAIPGLAPAAIQGGRHAGRAIQATLRGAPRKPFVYVDKGTMATIGRRSAVAMIGRLHLRGTLAWLGWLFVHLIFLIGFRNRVFVLFQWAWAYITFDRGARLITGNSVVPVDTPPPEVPRRWVLWRQDDNGTRFRVSEHALEAEARAAAKDFEAKGHKQLYSVEGES